MSYCDPNNPCEQCRQDALRVKPCICHKDYGWKTDSESRMRCLRCWGEITDATTRSREIAKLPDIIQRLRKYKGGRG